MKECAITAISSVAEGCGEDFGEYYDETFKLLIGYLAEEVPTELKQYKGQLIETITIMSVSVGTQTFMPYAQQLVEALLHIQDNYLEENDPQ